MSMMSTGIDVPSTRKHAISWVMRTPAGNVPSFFEGNTLEVVGQLQRVCVDPNLLRGSLVYHLPCGERHYQLRG